MLYLMMDKNAKMNLVKVGFSDGQSNLKTRRKAYFSYNPLAIMRSSCAGSRTMEKTCHGKLAEWGCSLSGTEWFIVPNELFDKLYKSGLSVFYPKSNVHFLEKFPWDA